MVAAWATGAQKQPYVHGHGKTRFGAKEYAADFE